MKKFFATVLFFAVIFLGGWLVLDPGKPQPEDVQGAITRALAGKLPPTPLGSIFKDSESVSNEVLTVTIGRSKLGKNSETGLKARVWPVTAKVLARTKGGPFNSLGQTGISASPGTYEDSSRVAEMEVLVWKDADGKWAAAPAFEPHHWSMNGFFGIGKFGL